MVIICIVSTDNKMLNKMYQSYLTRVLLYSNEKKVMHYLVPSQHLTMTWLLNVYKKRHVFIVTIIAANV